MNIVSLNIPILYIILFSKITIKILERNFKLCSTSKSEDQVYFLSFSLYQYPSTRRAEILSFNLRFGYKSVTKG